MTNTTVTIQEPSAPTHADFWERGNVDNFIQVADSSEKNREVFTKIEEYKADVVGITETGLDWRLIPQEDGMYQRTKASKRACKATVAHNLQDKPTDKTQHGGTLMMSFPETIPRLIDASIDPEKLGRWVSHAVEGKGSHTIRYVAAYNPCNSRGNSTVHIQHQEHFRRKGTDREPRQAFLEDLRTAATAWIEAGEKVVMSMDANEDVRTGPLNAMLNSLGFQEQITGTHSAKGPPPATHDRNTKHIAIDGIWTNFAHGELRCGHMGFGEGLPGDHRTAWIDIPFEEAFGCRPPTCIECAPPT